MIVLVASGVSGGHLKPALSTLQMLRDAGHDAILLVYGGGFREEGDSVYILSSPAEALKIVGTRRVEGVVSFGSRHVIPVVLTLRLRTSNILIHEQNVIPGRANRFLAPFARRILLSFKGSEPFWPSVYHHKLVVWGYPVIPPASDDTIEPPSDVPDDRPVVLFTGGSKGSVMLNVLAARFADAYGEEAFIVHQLGRRYMVRLNYSDRLLFGFEKNFAAYLRRADLVISRAGAGTIAELLALGKRAILVPLIGVAYDHQWYNARASGYPFMKFEALRPKVIWDFLIGGGGKPVGGNLVFATVESLLKILRR